MPSTLGLRLWPSPARRSPLLAGSYGRAICTVPGPGTPRSLFHRLVGEAGRTYVHLPLSELRDGRAPASLSRLPAGAIALADAEEEADLAALVEAGSEIARPVIWAGSAGLAAHVANALASASNGTTAGPPAVPRLSEVPSDHVGGARGSGAALVLVATREQIARQQVAALASCGAMVTEVAPDGPVTSWALERKPVLQAHLAAGGTVVVRAPASDASSEEVADHARLVVSAGETVRAGLAGTGIVATGGETARAVLEALGEKTGWVIGEVEMAMPLLVTDEGHLGLVTKAGSFGGPQSLVRAVDALKTWRQQVKGPLPADTVFFRAGRGDFDCVVAMYHDQGHGPVKVLGLEGGVNITLGLPIVRTSVDHGTAFDIAGRGTADERSLISALEEAARLSTALQA